VTNFSVGDHSALVKTATSECRFRGFSGGSVDALLGTVFVGRSNTGNNTGTDGRPSGVGTLTFSQGTIDVNTLELGYETVLTDPGVGSIGIVNVNGSASLVVNTAMELRPRHEQSIRSGARHAQCQRRHRHGQRSAHFRWRHQHDQLYRRHAQPHERHLGCGHDHQTHRQFFHCQFDLNLAVKAGVTPIVANNFAINAPTTINLRTLPVIGTYPAQFPLIQYTSPSGDLTTFVLGSLPVVGAVPYQGYLSNNTANFSVDIVITNGFVATGVDIWTGTNNANWDLTSPNWTLFGSPTLFINAAFAQFDDSAQGATNINLVGSLVPNTVTVSNNVKAYTFGGSGNLNGTSTLVKDGTGTLTLTNSGNQHVHRGILISNGRYSLATVGLSVIYPPIPRLFSTTAV